MADTNARMIAIASASSVDCTAPPNVLDQNTNCARFCDSA
jgi:hypothetical protein